MTTITHTSTLNLNYEEDRYETLLAWPIEFIDTNLVSKSGLYYNGDGVDDRVQCYFCDRVIGGWARGDIPNNKHHQLSRNCKFMEELILESDDDDEDFHHYEPEYKAYSMISNRLDTFDNWPMSLPVQPKQLAEAGFFYLGSGDRTSCFFCGVVIKHWMPGDDPWREHAKWHDDCHHLQSVKGLEYIARVKEETEGEVVGATSPSIFNDLCDAVDGITIDDTHSCKICFSEKREVVFVPCGHVVACVKCGFSFNSCPTCRKPVKMVLRLYFS
ncbi:baculoviral IAP repeat-containing protein 7-B-like [Arctopsyche grandis]|uniref:baculoviral IAP repeat-containing protein 7-B-like n=1 Tax=Arctopsyche grandis TaxID=121162 RepID=UPI00406D790B